MNGPGCRMHQGVAVVILAGGASARMGRDKALLRLDDGRTALAWVLEAARGIATQVLLAVDTAEHAAALCAEAGADDVDIALDERPGAGPLATLAGALERAEAPLLVALAADTPLVQPAVLQMLLAAAQPGVDAVVPVVLGVTQPLQAVYRTTLGPTVRDLVQRGSGSVQALLRATGATVRYLDEEALRQVDPQLRSFRGANTPAEWDALLAELREDRR